MPSKNIYYAIGGIILLLVVIGVFMMQPESSVSSVFKPDSDKYYAVFLKSDQAYFGQVSNIDNEYIHLTNVYYLSASKRLQPLVEEGEEGEEAIKTGPKFTLFKLGNELHDPADEMYIPQNEIMFIEALQDDSRILQAIDKAKNESVQN